jgi:hypothetical protein
MRSSRRPVGARQARAVDDLRADAEVVERVADDVGARGKRARVPVARAELAEEHLGREVVRRHVDVARKLADGHRGDERNGLRAVRCRAGGALAGGGDAGGLQLGGEAGGREARGVEARAPAEDAAVVGQRAEHAA